MRVDARAERTASLPTARRFPDLLVVLLAAAAAVVLVAVVLRPPDMVEAITIENPTSYQLTVDVIRPDDGSQLRLGSVPRDGSVVFREVIDHGEEWTVRLSYAGQDGGEFVVDRAALVGGWAVPMDVDETLQDTGLRPSSSTSPGMGGSGTEAEVEGEVQIGVDPELDPEVPAGTEPTG